jgi:inosine-uridine nucleoside N-ribohydrolase
MCANSSSTPTPARTTSWPSRCCFRIPSVTIDAITVVNGLAHVDAGARNMGRLLDLAGRKHVPVFAGRNAPLHGAAEFPAEWRKISDDLPGVPLPPASRLPETRRAADYLVEAANAREPVQILALGPLTNIAEALQRDRSMAAHIREIVIMGGAVRVPGNLQDGGVFHTKNSTAEWNIFIDPLAAASYFDRACPSG